MEVSAGLTDVFFHRMPMGIAIFDTSLRLQRFNPTWESYVEGFTPDLDAVTAGLTLDVLLPEGKDVLWPYLQRALAGETAVEDTLRLTTQDAIFYWNAAFTPVVANGAVTGVLLVVTDVTRQVLTQQLLERHVADRTRKLSALYEVMAIASEPVGLEQILQQSLAKVLTAVRAQAGMIQLLNPSGTHLHLAVQQGLPTAVTEALATISSHDPFFAPLLQDGLPLVLRGLATAPHALPALRQSDLYAYAGVQMYVKSGPVGILSAFRLRQRPFSKEDIALLDSVADQIGAAVENARLRKENEQLLVLEERNRLARELHDAITQSLYSLTLFAEANRRFALEGNLSRSAEYATLLGDTARQALREMRLLVHNLRPSILEQVGLVRAIQQRLDAVERRAGIHATFQVHGELSLPAHVEEAIFHISQEALNNALKHASATEVHVSLLLQDDLVQLVIHDNGCGFDPDRQHDSGGLGLVSMRERVALLNGALHITSSKEKGTTLTLTLQPGREQGPEDKEQGIEGRN